MASFVLLLICLGAGMAVAHWGRPPPELPRCLNWWVLNIALPAAVLQLVPQIKFELSLWFLFVPLWLVFMLSWGVFDFLGRRLQWSPATTGCMVLTGGLCNTSFVGFPLIEALRGHDMLAYAAVADQVGGFLCVAVFSGLVIARYTGAATDLGGDLRGMVRFPPFIALLLALLITLFSGPLPLADAVLGRLTATLSPLALFSVGLQLRPHFHSAQLPPLLINLGWKLGVAPLLVFGLGLLLQVSSPILSVGVLQAAMAPMITAGILAQQHDLDPPLANLAVGIGVLLSFITVPLWNLAL